MFRQSSAFSSDLDRDLFCQHGPSNINLSLISAFCYTSLLALSDTFHLAFFNTLSNPFAIGGRCRKRNLKHAKQRLSLEAGVTA